MNAMSLDVPPTDLLTEEEVLPLTLRDRCDACGVAAKVRVINAHGLLFCGHHFREHEASLIAKYGLLKTQLSEMEGRE